MGVTRDTECGDDATQEDGLCNSCRCKHGCCEDHGFEWHGLHEWIAQEGMEFDPAAMTDMSDHLQQALEAFSKCKMERGIGA